MRKSKLMSPAEIMEKNLVGTQTNNGSRYLDKTQYQLYSPRKKINVTRYLDTHPKFNLAIQKKVNHYDLTLNDPRPELETSLSRSRSSPSPFDDDGMDILGSLHLKTIHDKKIMKLVTNA